ncbi:MAG: hypothetical protein R2911_38835 [Caldilineaceae bacterium]
MELVISISNDEKAEALVEFLRVLDFIDSIRMQRNDLNVAKTATEDFLP